MLRRFSPSRAVSCLTLIALVALSLAGCAKEEPKPAAGGAYYTGPMPKKQ